MAVTKGMWPLAFWLPIACAMEDDEGPPSPRAVDADQSADRLRAILAAIQEGARENGGMPDEEVEELGVDDDESDDDTREPQNKRRCSTRFSLADENTRLRTIINHGYEGGGSNSRERQIKLGTINIGSCLKEKADRVLKFMEREEIDMLVVTETHLFGAERHRTLIDGLAKTYGKGVRHFCKSEEPTMDNPEAIGGVSIFYDSNRLVVDDLKLKDAEPPEQTIAMKIKWKNESWAVWGVYGDSGSIPQKEHFWKQLIPFADALAAANMETILLGDINVAHFLLDRADPHARDDVPAFQELTSKLLLYDTWRDQHKTAREFSFFRLDAATGVETGVSRIDAIWASQSVRNNVKSAEILPADTAYLSSDHKPVVTTIETPEWERQTEWVPQFKRRYKSLEMLTRPDEEAKKVQAAFIEQTSRLAHRLKETLDKDSNIETALQEWNKLRDDLTKIASILLDGKDVPVNKPTQHNRQSETPEELELAKACNVITNAVLSVNSVLKGRAESADRTSLTALQSIPHEFGITPPPPEATEDQIREWLRRTRRKEKKLTKKLSKMRKDTESERIRKRIQMLMEKGVTDMKRLSQIIAGAIDNTSMKSVTFVDSTGKEVTSQKAEDVLREGRHHWANYLTVPSDRVADRTLSPAAKLALRAEKITSSEEMRKELRESDGKIRAEHKTLKEDILQELRTSLAWPNLAETPPLYAHPDFPKRPAEAKEETVKMCEELTKPFTAEEIGEVVRALQNKKAIDGQGLVSELFKYGSEDMLEALANLFTIFIKKNKLPEDFRESRIFMLYKNKKDKSDPGSYRPVAIVSIGYKIMAKTLQARARPYLEDNKVLTSANGGFRGGRSCAQKQLILRYCMDDARKNGKELHLCYIDVKGAFDSVKFNRFQETLEYLGFTPQARQLFQLLMEGNRSKVLTGVGETDWFDLRRGVRQGCPLSPILWDLYIEPMLYWWQSRGGYRHSLADKPIAVMAWADDMALLANSEAELQQQFRRLEVFLDVHEMEINPLGCDKTVHTAVLSQGDCVLCGRHTQGFC